MKYYLAIDIGASSGRHIVGWKEGGDVKTEEVFRFPNGVKKEDGHLVWDMEALLGYVKEGIEKSREKFGQIESLAIDTWGVDYVLLKGDEEVWPCYAYRDSRTDASIPVVHELVPFSELYAHTGIQFQTFNTIYQFKADQMAGRLEDVTDYLMVPEYLTYKLCGVKAHEYTNATTGALINAKTKQFDLEILKKAGLPLSLFANEVTQPGTQIGTYEGIKCILCPSHDTASAVEGIPMGEEIYLNSGTWSLLGIKSPEPITTEESERTNWTNEGGVGYIRYLKNIMGMWVVNRLRDELCPETPFPEIVKMAEESTFAETVDVNAQIFMAPESMKGAFDEVLGKKPETAGDYFRCAYQSLAICYKTAIEELENNTGMKFEALYIVGGGAKNAFLNRLTEEATGKKVIALPMEATALGNLKSQMEQN
ncbi:MAG: rhamnulokinase [Lachnospiraceae bacterium]|nr:rhamnulokinase [Lachnospiraceae bacterium]